MLTMLLRVQRARQPALARRLAQGPPGEALASPKSLRPCLPNAAQVTKKTPKQKKKTKKREGRRWSVLQSLFRNKVHLGNRCCCCNKPGAAGCSVAPSPKHTRGESSPAAISGAARAAGTGCLNGQNLSVQLQCQPGRAAVALDQLFLHVAHPSHP